MTPDGIRDKFDLYRKWFRTLLVKEFLNLPTKYQKRFLVILQKFVSDCKKVLEEGKKIKEKVIRITVQRIETPDNREESYIVCGITEDVNEEIRMSFPVSKPKPRVGDRLHHTIFSVDEKIWYSSKEELITGRSKK